MTTGARPGGDDAPVLGSARVADRLLTWLADARVDDAATERRRQWWLRRQAEEQSSLVGVLLDLAERGRPIVLSDRSGSSHRGRLSLIGANVVVIETGRGDIVVPLVAVTSVRSDPGGAATTGDRRPESDVDLATVLMVLAGDRPRVTVMLEGGESMAGELAGSGLDVLRLLVDGPGRDSAYVALGAISHVKLVG